MKFFFLTCTTTLTLLSSCVSNISNSQSALDPKEFAEELENTKGVIIDVRTPQEFATGHLENACNMDWNSSEFHQKFSIYEKNQRLYIYCLSGGRSHTAAESLRSSGYSNVIEMNGGILKWQNEGLPLTKSVRSEEQGMDKDALLAKLKKSEFTIVDFNATWCAPCKKLKPLLEHYVKDHPTVNLITIDVDINPDLVAAYSIDAIPRILVFKGTDLINDKKGLLTEQEVNALIP